VLTTSALWSARPVDQFRGLRLPGHRLVCRSGSPQRAPGLTDVAVPGRAICTGLAV